MGISPGISAQSSLMWQRIRCNEVSNGGNDPRGGCVDSVCCCVSPARKVCLSVSRVSISTLTGRTGQEAGQRECEGLRGDDCSLDTFPAVLISISATKEFIRRHSPRTRRGRRSQVNGEVAKTSSCAENRNILWSLELWVSQCATIYIHIYYPHKIQKNCLHLNMVIST